MIVPHWLFIVLCICLVWTIADILGFLYFVYKDRGE